MDLILKKTTKNQQNNKPTLNICYCSAFFSAFGSFLATLFSILQYFFGDSIGIIFAIITVGCTIALTSIKETTKRVRFWKYIEECANATGVMNPILLLSGFLLAFSKDKYLMYMCIFFEVVQLIMYVIAFNRVFSFVLPRLMNVKTSITKGLIHFKLSSKVMIKNLRLYCRLPHIWILVCILLLSMLMLYISFETKESNSYISSLSANIFAGLITGVVICLISTAKTMQIYKTESIVRWLTSIHDEFLKYRESYNKMISFGRNKEFNDSTELYDLIYDTLCVGNDINSIISQGRFNKSLPFDTYKYCKRHLGYDVVEKRKDFDDLREIIMRIDSNVITSKQLMNMFSIVDNELFRLNGDSLHKIDDLKAKLKALNSSVI